jgi:DNA-binding transcriptional regulator YiaG
MTKVKFKGFGFPILILKPKYLETQGGKVLDVDYTKLEILAFKALIYKSGRYTGAEIKFIRNHMEYTQKTFADLLPVNRSSVTNWESKNLKQTGMDITTELIIKIEMVKFLKLDLNKAYDLLKKSTRSKVSAEMIEIKNVA